MTEKCGCNNKRNAPIFGRITKFVFFPHHIFEMRRGKAVFGVLAALLLLPWLHWRRKSLWTLNLLNAHGAWLNMGPERAGGTAEGRLWEVEVPIANPPTGCDIAASAAGAPLRFKLSRIPCPAHRFTRRGGPLNRTIFVSSGAGAVQISVADTGLFRDAEFAATGPRGRLRDPEWSEVRQAPFSFDIPPNSPGGGAVRVRRVTVKGGKHAHGLLPPPETEAHIAQVMPGPSPTTGRTAAFTAGGGEKQPSPKLSILVAVIDSLPRATFLTGFPSTVAWLRRFVPRSGNDPGDSPRPQLEQRRTFTFTRYAQSGRNTPANLHRLFTGRAWTDADDAVRRRTWRLSGVLHSGSGDGVSGGTPTTARDFLPARLRRAGWRTTFCSPFCGEFFGFRFHDAYTPALFDNHCPALVNVDPVPVADRAWRERCIVASSARNYGVNASSNVCGCEFYASLQKPGGQLAGGDVCAYGASPTDRALDYVAGAWRADGASRPKFAQVHLDHGHFPEGAESATLLDDLLPPFFDEVLRVDPNTVILLLSDHGRARRVTPFLNVVVPAAALNSTAVRNLEVNRERLVTLADVHATLSAIASVPVPVPALPAINLVTEEVPAGRTCADASVLASFCPCIDWASVDNVPSRHVDAALAFISRSAEPCTPLKAAGGFVKKRVRGAYRSSNDSLRFVIEMTNGAMYAVVVDSQLKTLAVNAEHSYVRHEHCTPRDANVEFCMCAD
jgi:Protein of unknown function (DUF229)